MGVGTAGAAMEHKRQAAPPLPPLTSERQARQLLHERAALAMGRCMNALEDPDACWPVLVGQGLAVCATWARFGIKADDHLPLAD